MIAEACLRQCLRCRAVCSQLPPFPSPLTSFSPSPPLSLPHPLLKTSQALWSPEDPFWGMLSLIDLTRVPIPEDPGTFLLPRRSSPTPTPPTPIPMAPPPPSPFLEMPGGRPEGFLGLQTPPPLSLMEGSDFTETGEVGVGVPCWEGEPWWGECSPTAQASTLLVSLLGTLHRIVGISTGRWGWGWG